MLALVSSQPRRSVGNPVHDGIFAESVIRRGGQISDGRLIGAGHGDDRPDIAGIGRRPLDSLGVVV